MGSEGVKYSVRDEGSRKQSAETPKARKFDIVKTVRVVKEEVRSKRPKLFSEHAGVPDVFKNNLKDDALPLS